MEALVTKRAHAATYAAPRSILRFGIVGLVSPLLYALLVNLFTYAGALRPLAAFVLAYAIAASYILQSRFTFRVADDPVGQIGSFVLVSLGGLVLSALIMLILCANRSAFP